MKRLWENGLRPLVVALFWLGIWQGAAMLVNHPLILPTPADMFSALFRLSQTAAFWGSTGRTLLRVLVGFLLAVGVGAALGMLCHFVKAAEVLLSPLRTVIRATPVTSFIILVLLWMAKGQVPVFISFLMVLPIIWTAVQEAFRTTDPQLLEMARAYQFPAWKKLRWVYFPSVQPHFAAACLTGLGFAWKSGIAAEAIAAPLMAIGTNLKDAQTYLQPDNLFAWTFTVILLSMGLEKLMRAALRRLKGGAQT